MLLSRIIYFTIFFREDEEDVSYDLEYLFPNIPVKETMDHITDQIQICMKKNLTPM